MGEIMNALIIQWLFAHYTFFNQKSHYLPIFSSQRKAHHHCRPQHQLHLHPALLASSPSGHAPRRIPWLSHRLPTAQRRQRLKLRVSFVVDKRDLDQGPHCGSLHHPALGHLHPVPGLRPSVQPWRVRAQHHCCCHDRWRRWVLSSASTVSLSLFLFLTYILYESVFCIVKRKVLSVKVYDPRRSFLRLSYGLKWSEGGREGGI